ncbi:MAG: hypothetical protein ABIY70_11140 [Capsulimonas sp.]|uniref:hypothetical protein n=1 Tax=Capsulimonas sp. TaxID=2494211 RepID=UPI0032639FBC
MDAIRRTKNRLLAFATGFFLIVCALVWFTHSRRSPPSYSGVVAEGKHVRIFAPMGERSHIDRLLKTADHALERYAGNLGVSLTDQRFDVYLYDKTKDYEQADAAFNSGRTKANLAFCNGSISHIYVRPGPRGMPAQDIFNTQATLAHELCHAIHQRKFPSYDYLPDWLNEGVADVWAEAAMSNDGAPQAELSSWYSAYFENVQDTIQRRRLLPLSKLTSASFTRHTHDYRGQLYGEAYILVRMLDDPSPSNSKQRERFRQFLNEVNSYPASKGTDTRVNARFSQIFGGSASKGLMRDYLSYVKNTQVFPWFARNGNVHTLANGSLLTESYQNQTIIAFHKTKNSVHDFKICCDIDISPVGTREVDIVLSNAANNYYHAIYFGPKYSGLLTYNGEYHNWGRVGMDPKVFQSRRHRIELHVRGHHLTAKFDGKRLLDINVVNPEFSSEHWGVGCCDSSVVFSNLHRETGDGAYSAPS